MSGRPARSAAPDAATYEKRMRAGMRLMARANRDAVAREVMGGIGAQVAAKGGDFHAVAQDLDDPAWVGRQMVRVYGVAAPWKAAAVLAAALMAWVSVPGAMTLPAAEGASIALSLVGVGALLVLIFMLILRQMTALALAAAAAAAVTRAALLALPQEGVALFDQLSLGELSFYLLATVLVLVVAGVPALAMRVRGDDE